MIIIPHLTDAMCPPIDPGVCHYLRSHNGCLVLRQAILSLASPLPPIAVGGISEKGQMGQIFLWCQFLIAARYFKYLEFPPSSRQPAGTA